MNARSTRHPALEFAASRHALIGYGHVSVLTRDAHNALALPPAERGLLARRLGLLRLVLADAHTAKHAAQWACLLYTSPSPRDS